MNNKYKIEQVDESPYLYVERTCSIETDDKFHAINKALSDVLAFTKEQRFIDLGHALSVYYSYQPAIMVLRAGFFITLADVEKASKNIHADVTPTGKVLKAIHCGSYRNLTDTYTDMAAYMKSEGITINSPSWEVYLNSPETTAEENLKTEISICIA